MAAAAATPEDAPPARSGPSLVVQIAVLLVMTLVAMGLGYVAVGFIRTDAPAASEVTDEHAAPAEHADKKDAGHGDAKDAGDVADPSVSLLPNAVMLPPITVNLAAPAETWIRAELTLIFAGPPDNAVAEAIHQDLLAFLRTIKLHQVQGASGFQHLRSDLDMRARTRSDGKVTTVLIRTLLFE